MATRRILKKVLNRTALELVTALEASLKKPILNKDSVGRFIDNALRVGQYKAFPLVVQGNHSGAFHIVFGWYGCSLEMVLRVDPGVMDLSLLEKNFEEHRSDHPHVQVSIREATYEAFKQEWH